MTSVIGAERGAEAPLFHVTASIPKIAYCSAVTLLVTYAPILMQVSSGRNNRLLQEEYGSACQHADPLGPAPGCRDQSCARGYSPAQVGQIRTADSVGRYLRRPEFCPADQRALEISGTDPQAFEP